MSEQLTQVTLNLTPSQLLSLSEFLHNELFEPAESDLPADAAFTDSSTVTPSNSFAVDADPFETLKAQTENIIDASGAIELDAEIELDSAGLPWDERIHASSKNKDKDGTWRYKQKIDRVTLVPQVEAELRAAMEKRKADVPLESLFPTQTPTAEPSPDLAGQAFGNSAPSTPPPPVQTAQMTFAEILPLYTKAMSQGLLSDESVNQVLSANFQLNSFGELAAHPHLIAAAAALLGLTAQQ